MRLFRRYYTAPEKPLTKEQAREEAKKIAHEHVKAYQAQHPGMSFREALTEVESGMNGKK